MVEGALNTSRLAGWGRFAGYGRSTLCIEGFCGLLKQLGVRVWVVWKDVYELAHALSADGRNVTFEAVTRWFVAWWCKDWDLDSFKSSSSTYWQVADVDLDQVRAERLKVAAGQEASLPEGDSDQGAATSASLSTSSFVATGSNGHMTGSVAAAATTTTTSTSSSTTTTTTTTTSSSVIFGKTAASSSSAPQRPTGSGFSKFSGAPAMASFRPAAPSSSGT